jgi:uncharacterized protein
MTRRRDTTRSKQRRTIPSLWDARDDDTALSDGPLPDDELALSIRDSLYDIVPLGMMERDLINTEAFLRLQQVKQLGFVYRIWPGATHTRYEHSLGVYCLALRAVRVLLGRHHAGLRLREADLAGHPVRTLLAAALLHDIGHYPFSHAVEELGIPIESHEVIGRRLITTGEIAETLRRYGLDPIQVANVVDAPRGREITGVQRVLAQLLSGALDVDKLDYLPRDARGCNVPYGGVDVTRLLGALRVEGAGEQQRLAVDAKGISALHSLVHARQEMFDNIYWHHTNRAMTTMLLRAVQEAMLAGSLSPLELTGHDDASLLALLASERMPPATRDLVEGLRRRRAHKLVVELSSRAGRLFQQISALYWDAAKRRRAELALVEELRARTGADIPEWGILIDIPKPEKWEMDVTIVFDDPPVGMQRVMSWSDATGQTPDELGRYEAHQRRVRLVAHPEVRETARAHQAALLSRLDHLAVL